MFYWSTLAFLCAAVVALWLLDDIYRWRSNLVYYTHKDLDAPLEVMVRERWEPLNKLSIAELDAAIQEVASEDGFRVGQLSVRRNTSSLLATAARALCDPVVTVALISPAKFHFGTSFRPDFQGCTAKERLNSEQAVMAITANFRDPEGKPLGWVYHKGQMVNRPFPKWTGAFFVKNGTPYFGPKSLIDEIQGEIEEGSQVYPSVMKNHTVFGYVDLSPDKHFDGRRVTYRALAGTRRDGTVIFVLSGEGGVMTVSEVTAIAEKLQVQHATLLDGGRALQYSMQLNGDRVRHFTAFNTQVTSGPAWAQAQRSPVYIVIKRKTS
ncbi:MAG: phosphodiester glycosidase family protein [Verrucomicrobiaceae bacterium]|nr:phosphodiester glycosidase family protein [Verrucomicrobiaceae bacterium]